MGVHQLVSNNKRTKRQKSNYAVAKSKRRLRKQRRRGTPAISVENIELLSDNQLKHKISHPRCNITVSGKRKHKVLKRLRHSLKDKSKMEVESVSPAVKDAIMAEVSEKTKTVSRRSTRSSVKSTDVDMKDEEKS